VREAKLDAAATAVVQLTFRGFHGGLTILGARLARTLTNPTSSLDEPNPAPLGGDGDYALVASLGRRKDTWIALLSVAAIAAHLVLRFAVHTSGTVYNLPLFAALALGGVPLVYELLMRLLARQFGSDLLAGMSIVTSVFLEEYLAGTFVVLMLSSGGALSRSPSACRARSPGPPHAASGTLRRRPGGRRLGRWPWAIGWSSCRTKSVRSTAW
jgi:hypothetical protein